MNSLKKIALTIAAALVGTMLIAAPANAAASIAVSGGTGAGTSALAPTVVNVPSDNTVDAIESVQYSLTGIDTGTVVSVVATNAFIVTARHTVSAPVTSASGSSTLSVSTGTGNTATFFVYTKSTSVGTIVITNAGTTSTYYIQGTAGPAYNISPVVSATANTSSVVEYLTTVTDVFGNPSAVTPLVTAIGATISTGSSATGTTGLYKVSVTYPATAGQAALGFSISALGSQPAVSSVTKFVTVSDLATTLASRTAELAEEKVASAKALADAKALSDSVLATAKIASDKALADAKVASDIALATAKVASDKALADAKIASDKALADAKSLSDASMATAAVSANSTSAKYKAKYNALVKRWNKANPKVKIALLP
jgi:hypothetical protein